MKLEEYLENHNIKAIDFAKKLKISRSALSNLLSGKRRPSDSLKMRIFHATQGAVHPTEWFDYSSILNNNKNL